MYLIRNFIFVSIIVCFTINFSAGQVLSIVSWNLKDFGQSRDDDEIKMIAEVIKNADVVAIQEVVAKHPGGAKAVARLTDQLNRMGAKWESRISHPTESSSPYIRERYAYIWKTSKVSLTRGRPTLIKEISSKVEREPFLAQFKLKNGEVVTLVNYHACTHKKHFPEREEISYISNWLIDQSFNNVIWLGDMNLVVDDIAFESILSSGYSSVLSGEKTSLKTKCKNGNYLSRAEDNIIYKFSSLNFSGGRVLDFIDGDKCTDVSWKRVSLSDHLGVEILLE